MKLSTLLLTTTALVVAGSAYAADLPAKKGAPAAKAAPSGCAAFGAGYFAIPGGDNCLKIGGFVRSNNTFTSDTTSRGTAPYSFAGSYRLTFDAKSNSDVGAIASNIQIDDTATSYASISVAGLTAGQFDDRADIYSFGIKGGDAGGRTAKGFLYQVPAGTSTVSIGVVSSATTWNGTASSRPDLQLGLATSMGPASLDVVAISHEALGTTSGSYNGYALIGTAGVTAGSVKLLVQGGTASGASNYVSGYSFATTMLDVDSTSSTASTSSLMGAKASVALGTGTVNAYGNSVSVSGASGSTTSLKSTIVGLNYALPVAKGLTVTPEVYNYTYNTGSGNTSSNNVYLRIQRDF